ncbi:hypothetical protein JOF56_002736 [Kibdelosporangium banguiense]|uniref:LPXTG-motif cell wall anchor domain-containing protein n=1 Tax=Kibdelosporangium banguiense TaxID=1365924 RepID=A0ABS4TD44_9PSEU|nr:hypothetical protein [Kibdelosporangium banguiense]MBP2322351.1 hypothetical protein [Kibdelosporangium banguiense]
MTHYNGTWHTIVGGDSHGIGTLGLAAPNESWTIIVWIVLGAAILAAFILLLVSGVKRR